MFYYHGMNGYNYFRKIPYVRFKIISKKIPYVQLLGYVRLLIISEKSPMYYYSGMYIYFNLG